MRNGWAHSGPSWSWNSGDGGEGSSPLPTGPKKSRAGGSVSSNRAPAAASTSAFVAPAAPWAERDRTSAMICRDSSPESIAVTFGRVRSRNANGSTCTAVGGSPNTARQTAGSTGGEVTATVTPGRTAPLISGWNTSPGPVVTNVPQSATSG